MKVPLADLHGQYMKIKPEIDAAIQGVITSSQFILGKAVLEFETAFAKSHGVRHCIAVGSGTDALHAALWGAGIGQGDAVVTTPFTFIATVEAILLCGARPVFVDIDPRTFNLDPDKLGALLNTPGAPGESKVRGILPIHLYGQTADMDPIMKFAAARGIHVIEDACQAHLAKYKGKTVGNFGETACFSFYPGKNIGAFGEGGAITTNDDALAIRLRQFRDHGQVEKYKHSFSGHNYRMDGIQGAVLGAKLPHLEEWTARRRSIAAQYHKQLRGISGLTLPFESPDSFHVYHLFVITTERRDALQSFLAGREISTAIAYPIPLHFQEAYRYLGYKAGDFPVCEQASKQCLALPMFAEMTDEQIAYVVESIRLFFRD